MLQTAFDKTKQNLQDTIENLKCQKKTFIVVPEEDQEDIVSEPENEDELNLEKVEAMLKKTPKI